MVAALHDLVPRLDDDRRLRRAALALKRAAYNARPSPLPAAEADALPERLPAEARTQVAAWSAAAEACRSVQAQARSVAAEELASASAGLAGACAAPPLARGVALASPSLARDLARPDLAAQVVPGSRLSRSCLGYLARAAVKTSPFSTFTTVGLTAFGEADRRALGRAAGATRVAASRALATELLLTLAAAPAFAPAFRYRVHDGVARPDGRPRVLVSRAACGDGFFWRHEQVVRADAYAAPLARLDRLDRGGPSPTGSCWPASAATRRPPAGWWTWAWCARSRRGRPTATTACRCWPARSARSAPRPPPSWPGP